MLQNKLGEIIRTDRDLFKTPNLHRVNSDNSVEVYLENFRRNQQDQELILFFQFENQIYFPLWFEFRSINNNLLFLFKEYNVNNFSELELILTSSLEKEEHYEAKFMALVFKTKQMPPFSVHLPEFKIESHQMILREEE